MKKSIPYLLMLCAFTAKAIDIPQHSDMRGKRLDSLTCLSVNNFHEARSESDIANIMIMGVVLNRMHDKRYPNNICDVIFDEKQFSWTHDTRSDKIIDTGQYKRLYKLAEYVMMNQDFVQQMAEGANHYHSKTVDPNWNKVYDYITTIDNHHFYRWN